MSVHIPEPGRDSVSPGLAGTLPPTTVVLPIPALPPATKLCPTPAMSAFRGTKRGLRVHAQTLANGFLLNQIFTMLKRKVKVLVAQLCGTLCDPLACPWNSLSMEFSRQEYWSKLPFSSPGELPDPGIEPRSPALQADSLLSYQGSLLLPKLRS